MYSEVSPWLSSGYFDELAKPLADAGCEGYAKTLPLPDLFTAVLHSQGALHPKSEGFFAQSSLLVSAALTSISYVGFS